MGVDGLSEREQLSLVVLLKALITSDGSVSTAENMEVSLLAGRLDSELFRRAESIKLRTPQERLTFLNTVARQYARDVIYDVLCDVARADGIQPQETVFLDELSNAWDIVVVEGHASNSSAE